MTYSSLLTIRVAAGRRDEAVTAFRARRCIEECAELVPGFLEAELLCSQAEPDVLCVRSRWRDLRDHEQWLAHPARMAQLRDLSGYVAPGTVPRSTVFRGLHAVTGCRTAVPGGPDAAVGSVAAPTCRLPGI